MLQQALESVKTFRGLMNEGNISEHNRRITDDFFAVFSMGDDSSFETFNAEQYREGNLEAGKAYEGRSPFWEYKNLGSGVRSDNEIIISSQIDFYLNKRLIKMAFCTEIYRKEEGVWKLVRQYMEKYDPDRGTE
ncbi:MAG TPA: DUF4440 domain-containing protein [Bacillales bacterium]|nr:DUF4440 domain-containing protein [Bacillales bacterium]